MNAPAPARMTSPGPEQPTQVTGREVTTHLVEANVSQRVLLLVDAEYSAKGSFVVVADDAFSREDDSPNPPDRITIASGQKALRGTIVDHAYVVELDA